MTGSSLEKLAGRVRSAVQETNTLRTENSRLKAHLAQLTAERNASQKGQALKTNTVMSSQPNIDRRAILERLKSILGRLDRLEQQLDNNIERQ